jgi:ubiquinol-cytochrome c reductase iron-sulfur subunit
METTVAVTNGSSISARPSALNPSRRDFLYIATTTVGAVGVAASMVPLIAQMNPDASTVAAGGAADLDLTTIQPGQQVLVRWRGRPIFVVNRTPKILASLRSAQLLDRLADPKSKQLQQPPYAENWHRSIKPEYGIFVGICTHLGCIPQFLPLPNPTTPVENWLGGYFCACHGSKYDLAGRVFKNVPAPYNLPVPPYHFVGERKIRIGENLPGVDFDFSSISQI